MGERVPVTVTSADDPTPPPNEDDGLCGSGKSCWSLCKNSCTQIIPIATDNMIDAVKEGDLKKIAVEAVDGVEDVVESKIGIDSEHFSKGVWDLLHLRLWSAGRHFWNLLMDGVAWLLGETLDPSVDFNGADLGNVIEGLAEGVIGDADPDTPGNQIDWDKVKEGIEGATDENAIDIDSIDGRPSEEEEEDKPRGWFYQLLRLVFLVGFMALACTCVQRGWV